MQVCRINLDKMIARINLDKMIAVMPLRSLLKTPVICTFLYSRYCAFKFPLFYCCKGDTGL